MSMNESVRSDAMFANVYSYLGVPFSRNPDDADVFVIGLPYDLATSGRAGTRSGPGAIRRASSNLRWEEKRWPWGFDVFDKIRVADYGDIEFPVGNHEELFNTVAQDYDKLLAAGKTVLSFGGDHFVTLPLLRAHRKRHGKLAMIHFDAHTDTYSEEGAVYNHGCMFYHAPREGLIDASKSIQIGIRTDFDQSKHEFAVIDAMAANDLPAQDIAEQIKARVGDLPVYLTFDIDALDPAYAPGTGTPVWGGLTSAQCASMLRDLAGINIMGGDIVEVSPPFDTTGATAIAGAHVAMELCCLALWNKRKI